MFEEVPAWPGSAWWQRGREVHREELRLSAGPEHCGWQQAAYLSGTALPAPRDPDGALWGRDPGGVLDHFPQARQGFRSPARLPADARPTGHVQGVLEPWTAPSDFPAHVYLVNRLRPDDAERWVRGGGGCA